MDFTDSYINLIQDFQSNKFLVGFSQNYIYEIEIESGTILTNTSIIDFSIFYDARIQFSNKLITGYSNLQDLVLINYYTGKIELNFTECSEKYEIPFDKTTEMIVDIQI